MSSTFSRLFIGPSSLFLREHAIPRFILEPSYDQLSQKSFLFVVPLDKLLIYRVSTI